MNGQHDLAAAYALDALDAGERAEYEVHLAGCEQCRAEVAELRETAAQLAGTVSEEPPSGLRDRVLTQVADTPQVSIRPTPLRPAAPAPAPAPAAALPRAAPPSRALTVWLAAAVVALVLGAAALGFLAIRLDQRLDDVSTRLAATEAQLEETEGQLASTEARLAEAESELVSAGELRAVLASNDGSVVSLTGPGDGTMRFAYSPTTGQGVLIGDGLAAVDEAQTYQAWLIDDGVPQPAGLFSPTDGEVTFAVDGDPGTAEAVAVTLEPAGGSPQPTTDILYLSELTGA
ncbi:MAG TPA: anti-sigma factor [Acidimicrobiia bacterium]|jgi:anti-sigma-K factor RskA|nr:anti-sigma factor [Acidimicrobiia bacterium]